MQRWDPEKLRWLVRPNWGAISTVTMLHFDLCHTASCQGHFTESGSLQFPIYSTQVACTIKKLICQLHVCLKSIINHTCAKEFKVWISCKNNNNDDGNKINK